MNTFLHEFLFRGRCESADEPCAWHIVLGATSTDAFGDTQTSYKTLSMAQAKAAGWTLPAALDSINAQLLQELERLNAENAELRSLIEDRGALDTPISA